MVTNKPPKNKIFTTFSCIQSHYWDENNILMDWSTCKKTPKNPAWHSKSQWQLLDAFCKAAKTCFPSSAGEARNNAIAIHKKHKAACRCRIRFSSTPEQFACLQSFWLLSSNYPKFHFFSHCASPLLIFQNGNCDYVT